MVTKKLTIIWSDLAKESLKSIYTFYKRKSLPGAKNVKNDILNAPKNIFYSKQYQQDDTNPKYRRIVVRRYKVLYREEKGKIWRLM